MQSKFLRSVIVPQKLAVATAILCIVLLLIQLSPPYTFRKAPAPKMGITHIVLFQFKSTSTPEEVNDISQRMVALKDGCIHPTSKKPYIKSASGGTDNSPEGIQNGITHAFIVEFESAEDRDYYVNDDPTHDEFKKLAGKVIEKAQVVDFTDGIFKS